MLIFFETKENYMKCALVFKDKSLLMAHNNKFKKHRRPHMSAFFLMKYKGYESFYNLYIETLMDKDLFIYFRLS